MRFTNSSSYFNQAPLKRIPKVDPTILLKTPETTLPPFGATNSSNLHVEQVREVSFSTFKSPDHIPSLLPGDLLYENRDRPANKLAPFVSPSLPVSTTEGLRNSILLKNEDQAPTETKVSQRFLAQGNKSSNPLAADQNNGKELTRSVSNIESDHAVQESKPRVSFTERLAAKKASRIKSNESSDSCLSNPNESDQTSAPTVMDKKHVHFDLEAKEVRRYTPECSEETKVADKSESSSSEDILDLVGDPEFLKPLSDINCQYPTAFEEKRWEVSFTSFGLNEANGSPVKMSTDVVDADDCSEMVTRFNSEYCPSPLPVSSCTENSDDIHNTIEPTAISTDEIQNPIDTEVKSNSPLPSEIILEPNVDISPIMPEIETNVPTFYENAQTLVPETQTIFVPFQDASERRDEMTVINLVNSSVENVSPITEAAKPDKEATSISYRISSLTADAQKSIEPSESLVTKSRVPKIFRTITRSDSLESSVMPAQSNPVIVQELHSSSIDTRAFPVEPQNNIVESDDKINLIIKPPSSQLLPPPAPFCHDSVSQPIITKLPVKMEETSEPTLSQICIDQQVPTPPLENWLKMKREMESTLENEKKRLESWFTSEIAQIKKQFENELATERERTENLSRLVESAKSEKEELAKREIVRLEETLAHLVEEKTRQVQVRLNNRETYQSDYRSVDRQDANVQTEEPATLPSRNLPFIQRASFGSSMEEIETAESNHARKDSHSRCESRDSPPVSRRDSRIKCQCDSLQKQVARVEREMQLLKQKNLSFQKNPPTRKKSTPVKAQREPWWLDTDESATSTASSVSDWRHSRGRSQSMTNLHASRNASSGRNSTPIQRARDLLSKSQTPRRAVTACAHFSLTPFSFICYTFTVDGRFVDRPIFR